jgi:hypothetical protein
MEKLNKSIEVFKNFFGMLKEGILILLFAFIFFFPKKINSILLNAGFTNGDVMGFKWEKQLADTKKSLQAAGNANSNAQVQIEKLQGTIDTLSKHVSDTKTLTKINEVKSDIAVFKANVQLADKSVQKGMIQQQEMLSSVSPDMVKPEYGWVYLGKVDATQTNWIKTEKMTIAETSIKQLKNNSNTPIALVDNVYLRKGSIETEFGFSTLPILSTVKTGEAIVVNKLKFVKAKDGNFYVWACTNINE